MRSRLFTQCCRLATGALVLLSTQVLAQVDWSDLFPEEGAKPAAPAPRQQPQRVAPAAPAVPAAQPVQVAPARPAARPQQAAKPVVRNEVRRAAKPKPSHNVARTQPQEDREFPAAADVAPVHFDRHSSQRTASPPDAEAAPRAAVQPIEAKPQPVAAEAVPAVAPPAVEAKAQRAAADRIEPPVVHESARVAAAPPPEPPAEVAAPAVVSRARRAAAVQKEPEPVAAEQPAAAADDQPVQVAAAAAEAAIIAGNRHSNSTRPADADGDVVTSAISPGEVISDKNFDKYGSFLSPGLEWAVRYGWRIKIGAPRHIELPRAYREATEKYSGQVRLGSDGLRLTNYIAGQPFPHVDPNDPQIAVKIMWNYDYGPYITDDVNAENFDSDTGMIGKNKGMSVERHYMIDNLRKLTYNGRLYVDPKPEMPNPDGLRFKESLHPLSEPFDLKGVGGTFYRYIDPERQDDSWLYLPQLRRVRRLSTAQRSDALFGQDSDVDSYYGYNGHIAWMDWKFLGERTIVSAVHAQHTPVKWQEPEDWAFDDTWEPRKVYVIEGTSKLPQYAYGKRVIFIDKEGWVTNHSDIYDRAGQLWKVWINLRGFKKEVIPGAKISRYPDEMAFTHAIVMLDTQLTHATKAALPSTHSQGEECVFFNMGAKSGTTEDFFTVANLIESGH